ncbi:MAG: type IV secretion system DNA-binding domain-containing protein [Pseudomonadota bacterium]
MSFLNETETNNEDLNQGALSYSGENFWEVNARIVFCKVSARIVFCDIEARLSELGQKTKSRLYYWAEEAPLADLHDFLKGKQGGTLMNPATEATAMEIRAELISNMAIWA